MEAVTEIGAADAHPVPVQTVNDALAISCGADNIGCPQDTEVSADSRLGELYFGRYLTHREVPTGQKLQYGEPAEIAERLEIDADLFFVHLHRPRRTSFSISTYQYMLISWIVKNIFPEASGKWIRESEAGGKIRSSGVF